LVRLGVLTSGEADQKAVSQNRNKYLEVERKMKSWARKDPDIPPLNVLDWLQGRRSS
jgi:hypothetical protein